MELFRAWLPVCFNVGRVARALTPEQTAPFVRTLVSPYVSLRFRSERLLDMRQMSVPSHDPTTPSASISPIHYPPIPTNQLRSQIFSTAGAEAAASFTYREPHPCRIRIGLQARPQVWRKNSRSLHQGPFRHGLPGSTCRSLDSAVT